MPRRISVEFVGDTRKLERSFARSAKAGKNFQASIGGVGSMITRSLAGFTGLTAGVAGLGLAVQAAFDEMRESRKVAAQTNAVLKSTGKIAGVTAEHVDELADAMLRKTGIDDEAIASAENLLLTFTNVRNVIGRGNDVFDQAVAATLDMATALGSDASQEAIRLGKALQDPIRGLTALRRVGVSFTDQQQAQIRTLVRSGQTLEAQKIILGELRREFGGSAEAVGKADGGINRLRETLLNFAAALVEKFMPAIEDATAKAQEWLDDPRNIEQAEQKAEGFANTVRDIVGGLAKAKSEGDAFFKRLQRDADTAAQQVRKGWLGALERLPTPGPIANWVKREREEAEKELEQLRIAAIAAAVDIDAALRIHDRPTVAEMFPAPSGTRNRPGGGTRAAGGLTGAERAAQRNQWFDARLARQLDRLQDLGLRKQLARLRQLAQEVRARLAVTRDATRRLTLEDKLLGILREQRQVQAEIADQVRAANDALKERADAIKSAVIDRLQRRQTDVLNKRALADAREQLRIAREIGGPRGIEKARRALEDARFDARMARLEAAPATLTRGGQFALGGVITINVHGVTDPDAVARKVAAVLQRRGRHTTTQQRGAAPATA